MHKNSLVVLHQVEDPFSCFPKYSLCVKQTTTNDTHPLIHT